MRSALFLVFLAVVTCSSSTFAEPTGMELYEKSCKMCHGLDGKGNAKLAQGMKIDPKLLDLTKPETKSKKDEALKTVVTDGTGKMKGFKNKLKPTDISMVVAHIRTLK